MNIVVEVLAYQLHREHRAAEKAMKRATCGRGSLNLLLHDHGWSNCSQQKYFVRRAKLILKRSINRNATCLMEAEEALQAQVLKRRLIVQGSTSVAYDGGQA